MAFIGPGMHGNALRARLVHDARELGQIGYAGAARIAQQGDFVQVDGQAGHGPLYIGMPELPEVETVRRGLEPFLVGSRIKSVELRRRGLRNLFPVDFTKRIAGARVKKLRRRAKYLLADLDNGQVLLTHLGMSGSFRLTSPKKSDSLGLHDHVVFTLGDKTRLIFNDPRRFGIMDVFARDEEAEYPPLAALGPEPLGKDFNGEVLVARLRRKKVAIKVALLDQRVVAGIGNIYASEALYAAGIDPRKAAGSLKKDQLDRLAASIQAVLRAAIASGGSTLRNHRQLDGSLGYFQHNFAVYDRAGQRCLECVCGGKKTVRAITQGGRTTFFCPIKQH